MFVADTDLFGESDAAPEMAPPDDSAPLAERLRPRTLEQVVGQDHLLSPEGALGRMIATGRLASMILWGPPGCGKTTIARLLADHTAQAFEPVSAVFSNVAELRKVFDRARTRKTKGQGTLLFVDEIHRFNRAQQDSFLPYVEDGTVTLIGATTENPSFELNAALLSRCMVMVLHRLDAKALTVLIDRAEQVTGRRFPLTDDARASLIAMADGDGRFIFNMLEELSSLPNDAEDLDSAALGAMLQRRAPVYDKDREGHYNLISALHKAVRGSDPDAALYWLARMLQGGEDPRYLARRITRMAVEDIGLADPGALPYCTAAWETYERLGSPEGELALAQAVIRLASAPKSNAGYSAYKAAMRSAKQTGSLMPPAHILNAPTKLMKQLGYGAGYEYDHDAEGGFSGQSYFPDAMEPECFYQPEGQGGEALIKQRLDEWRRRRSDRARREND